VRLCRASLGGDTPNSVPWIEHVLPTNPRDEWFQTFSPDEHLLYRDRLANLLPLSSEMNIGLSNSPYYNKRRKFLEDSMFKSARKFGELFEDWTPQTLQERGRSLAEWAIVRWPHNRP
jgi:hypothetical protein